MSQTDSFDDSHAITIHGGEPGVAGRELRPGDVIGGSYKLKSLVARGGMGYVFCAEHTMISREYALKMLAPEVLNETTRKRFESEGRAIANLDHVNIVKVYNMGLDSDGSPFYVMDLLDGKTLSKCIHDRDNFSLDQCFDILSQIASGLNYAHSKGIVHRDVKPSNIILIDEKGGRKLVKIVDFGLAKVLPKANLHSQSQTKIGEVFGSPFYMSPEQCEGKPVDARSDIYSLGCTFFQMLTGTPPYQGKNAMETMLLHQTEAVPSVTHTSSMAGLPPSLDVLAAKMMAKRPVDRYQTMEQIRHDIDRIKQGKAIGKQAGIATGTETPAVGSAPAHSTGSPVAPLSSSSTAWSALASAPANSSLSSSPSSSPSPALSNSLQPSSSSSSAWSNAPQLSSSSSPASSNSLQPSSSSSPASSPASSNSLQPSSNSPHPSSSASHSKDSARTPNRIRPAPEPDQSNKIDEPAGSRLAAAMVPIAAVVGVIVILASGWFIWLWFNSHNSHVGHRTNHASHSQNGGSGETTEPPSGKPSAIGENTGDSKSSGEGQSGVTDDYTQALAAYANFGPIRSNMTTIGHRQWHHFSFPMWSIGTVNIAPGFSKEAKGSLNVPAGELLGLEVGLSPESRQVLKIPYIFDQIGPDEFANLDIGGTDRNSAFSAMEGQSPENERVAHLLRSAAKWHHLSGLVLTDLRADKTILDPVNGLKGLTTLELHKCSFPHISDLADQPFLKRIEGLILYYGGNFDPIAAPLGKSPKLKSLRLTGAGLSPVALSLLSQSNTLKSLRIYLPSGMGDFVAPEIGQTEGVNEVLKHVDLGGLLRGITRIKSLESVTIHNTQLSPEQIKMMISCPNIHTLDLSLGAIPRAVRQQFAGDHRVVFSIEPPE